MPPAEVWPSSLADQILVRPRDPEDLAALGRALGNLLPGSRLKRSASGYRIPAALAPSLLEVGGDCLGIRWNAEARLFAENRTQAAAFHARLRAQLEELRQGGRPVAERLLGDRYGLDALDDHQWVNVAAMTLRGGYGLCLFDEQGAGKTVSLIFAFDVLVARDEVDFLLVVAPKSMLAEWRHDFVRFRGDLYKVALASGSRTERRAALSSGADIVVTNFETTVSMEDELRALLRRYRGRAVMAVDESYFVKSLDARRTQSIRRLREHVGRAFALCGTPAPNAPHDLVQQFDVVDFGMTFSGARLPEDRAEALPVVRAILEERGLYMRHLKADVLPALPAKRFHRVLVPLQPEQRQLYEAALHDHIDALADSDEMSFRREIRSYLARRSTLLQLCSNPASVVPGYQETPAKLMALDALVNEAVGVRGEKVVLWSFYTVSLEAVFERYRAFKPVRYDGTVADVAERREAVRRFQEDDETMLFVANPAAAGAGLTLHRARLAVYESLSNQAAHYLQSLDRIHRRGQERGVEYVILLCEGTLEEIEYERLGEKERAAQQLLGDPLGVPPTRQSLLAEAMEAAALLGSLPQ
jgi:SNF2 family DNA or RNA helicase